MLTKNRVREFVGNSAYFARGQSYADEGRVQGLRISGGEADEVWVEARVAGAGALYGVQARYDEMGLIECDCACPEFGRRQWMCKHVAAMLIAACEQESGAQAGAKPRPEAAWMRRWREAQEAQAREEARRREQEEREKQERFVEQMLFSQEISGRDRVRLRHEARGDVRLYPIFICEGDRAHLEMKIGRQRAYVVRSLWQFGRSAAAGGCERYGKELTFSHTHAELHPDDVALYERVVDICREQTANRPRAALAGAQLDSLMRLLLGREVEMRIGDQPAQRVRVVSGCGALTGQLLPLGAEHLLRIGTQNAVRGERGVYFFCPEEGEIRCASGAQCAVLAPLMDMAEAYPEGVRLGEGQLLGVAQRLLIPAGAGIVMTEGREVLQALTPMAMQPRFVVDMDGRERLICEVQHNYGAVVLRPGEENPHIRRDTVGEEEAAECARRLFPKEDGPGRYAFEGKEEAVYDLLSERLPELRQDGEVLIAERLKKMNVTQRRAITFGITKSGVELLVKADLGGLTQEDLEAAYAAYREKRKYVLLTDGTFLGGEALAQAAEAADVARGLNLTAQELAEGANVPMNRAMYLDAALKERKEMKLNAPGEVTDFVARLRTAKDAQAEPPKGLLATLRPYQLTGYHWLCALNDAGFGGILADDMGLGKTLQAIALLLREKEAGKALRALVVCPASLQLNWLSEAEKFAPTLRCRALLGTAAERKAMIADESGDAPDVLVVSYDQLRRDAQAYYGRHFTHMLLDEAQNIKNAASQGAKAAKAIDAAHRFAMTGTPIENRLSELWSIFDFLMPGYLLSYKKFKERFEAPIVQDGDEQTQKNLRLLVAPFILRRMKRDVLTDLPEKVETVMCSEMTAEQRKLYLAHAAKLAGELDTGADAAQQRMKMLAGLTRLRQLCCDPALCMEGYAGGSGKLEQCMELVHDAVQTGHEILLFSQFTTMLDILKERLCSEGLGVFMLTGDTPKEERMRLVQAFNAGEADVFLISLKAGGTGLNLTGADVVIHYDPWWNTAAQNQATDRAYRIGQTQSVQVYKLIASGSIEERILKLQEEKALLGDGVLEGDAPAALDEQTMRRLLL